MRPGDGLVHPVPLLALTTLIVNDHWAKAAHPSWITGKLSDVAGLVFFPLLLEAGVELVVSMRGRFDAPSRRVLAVVTGVTAIVFFLAKTSPFVNEEVRVADALLRYPVRLLIATCHHAAAPRLGRPSLVLDPTDLLALPALLIGWVVGEKRRGARANSQCSSVVQTSTT